jgi:hypothetical protein
MTKQFLFQDFAVPKRITLNGRCEAIDYLHFLTAKYYSFEILTNDADIAKLTRIGLILFEWIQLNANNAVYFEKFRPKSHDMKSFYVLPLSYTTKNPQS